MKPPRNWRTIARFKVETTLLHVKITPAEVIKFTFTPEDRHTNDETTRHDNNNKKQRGNDGKSNSPNDTIISDYVLLEFSAFGLSITTISYCNSKYKVKSTAFLNKVPSQRYHNTQDALIPIIIESRPDWLRTHLSRHIRTCTYRWRRNIQTQNWKNDISPQPRHYPYSQHRLWHNLQ